MECPTCKLENPASAQRCDCGHLFYEVEGQTRRCPYCAETIQAAAIKCRFCNERLNVPPIEESATPLGRQHQILLWNRKNPLRLVFLIAMLLALLSMSRFYYGGGIGFRIMAKDSPAFHDTFVNLDEIFGMPRIAVAAQHPAVKRQLEGMGIVRTDDEAHEDTRRKVQQEIEKSMEEARKRLDYEH